MYYQYGGRETQAGKRKIAGFFRQIRIITWKNLMLYKQNKSGIVCEVLFSTLFTLIFVLIVSLSEPSYMGKQVNFRKQIIERITDRDVLGKQAFFYYPKYQFVQDLLSESLELLKLKNPNLSVNLVAANVSNANDLEDNAKQDLYAFVSFESNFASLATLPDVIRYNISLREPSRFRSLHTNEIFIPKTQYMNDKSPEEVCQDQDSGYDEKYQMFNAIKFAIDAVIIKRITNREIVQDQSFQFYLQKFSCPDYISDVLKTYLLFFTPLVISLSFLVTFLVTISAIIREKESKMKEYLRLVGVNPTVISLCWMMRTFVIYLLISIILTITSTIKYKAKKANVLTDKKSLFLETDFLLVFITFIFYSAQVTCLSQLAGQIFSKPFMAKTVGIVFWFFTLTNFYGSFSLISKYIFCIFPNTALIQAVKVMFQYERSSKPLNFSNLFENLFNDGLNLGTIWIMMLFWSFVYLLLSWYIERIFPGEYGVKMPFYFPCMPSYWCEKRSIDDENIQLTQNGDFDNDEAFEQEPLGLYASVRIKNLTKKFGMGFQDEKTVVNDISLNFYENQITGFLGHNGAGKTTVTFMLSGLYSPSSGTAYILEHDIRTHMDKIRASVGFCPQNNILYDDLTVRQHLDLVASIKGFSNVETKQQILQIAAYVGLQGDLNKTAAQLSGGMKRRLSVAMAFIGDSKVIILDEPTSGLDPFNRRSLWELIRNYKQGRTIILTTHYMEEADALSDRIALMNHGQVKCCGSPLFLKDKFGTGYRLTINKAGNFDKSQLLNAVQNTIGREAIVESDVAREICIAIPTEFNNKLPALLRIIEQKKAVYGIDNYGISSSTVEEVFLKIGSIDINDNLLESKKGHDAKGKTEEHHALKNDNLSIAFSQNPFHKHRNRSSLIAQQLFSLCLKRFNIFRRRIFIAFCALFLPVIIQALLAIVIPNTANVISEAINNVFGIRSIPPYQLDLYKYGSRQTFPIHIANDALQSSFKSYFDAQSSKSGRPDDISLLSVQNQNVDDFVYAQRKRDVRNIVSRYYYGMNLDMDAQTKDLSANIYYSSLPYHTAASVLNQLDSFLLGYYSNNVSRSIVTTNAPVSIPDNSTNIDPTSINLDLMNCLDGMPFSYLDLINGLIIAFVISVTTIHLIRERINGSKSLQLLSGTHYSTYWLSNLIFDLMVYLFVISSLVVAIKVVAMTKDDEDTNETVIIGRDGYTLAYMFLFMVISSFSWASLSYVWSFLFKSDVVGFIVLLLVLGFACLFDMTAGYLRFFDIAISGGGGTLTRISDVIRYIFAFLFPNIAVKRAMFNLKLQKLPICYPILNFAFKDNYRNVSGLAFSDPGIGKYALLNAFNFGFGLIIIFLVESRLLSSAFNMISRQFKSTNPLKSLEEDVQNERDRIKSKNLKQLSSKEPILVQDLVQEFKKNGKTFNAVNYLSFGVQPNECFGLLGLNGAGKTTTIEILTGQRYSTAGNAFVNGFNIRHDRLSAIASLGFCPQFEYLPEYLTARESLQLYASLRGLKMSVCRQIIDDYINAFKLNEFQHKLVQNLSGGNKRKVSSAIAFIGNPKTVILDEPTSGMDPAARRYLWNVIKHARDCGMTILLTTHSMEESEALCTNIGIMVNGQFECFGNTQRLKSKFGKGYSLTIKCKTDQEQVGVAQPTTQNVYMVEQFIKENIPNAFLKDKQQQTLFYQIVFDEANNDNHSVKLNAFGDHVRHNVLSIAEIFSLVESNKSTLNIETYSLSQTTLEQVFLSFARKQQDPLHSVNKPESSVRFSPQNRVHSLATNNHHSNNGFVTNY